MKSTIFKKKVFIILGILLLPPIVYTTVEIVSRIEKADTFIPITIPRTQLDKMLKEGDLKLVNLVVDDKVVFITLRESALLKPDHQARLDDDGWSSKSRMPHYQMSISNSKVFWDDFARELNSTPGGQSVIYVNGNNPLIIRNENKDEMSISFPTLLLMLRNVYWDYGRLLWRGLIYLLLPALAVYVLILLIRRLRKPAPRTSPVVFSQNVNGHNQEIKRLKNFPLKLGDRIAFIPTEEIACFYAQDNHVYLYDAEGKEHLVEYTLADLETKLPQQFIRVHRSTIINSHLIQEIKKQPGSRFNIKLRDAQQKEIITGQSYASPVKQLFEI